MPAMPAPRINTDVLFGAPCSFGEPLKLDSAARPRLLIAWYIAAAPALMPIMRRRSRRFMENVLPSCIEMSIQQDFFSSGVPRRLGCEPQRRHVCNRDMLGFAPQPTHAPRKIGPSPQPSPQKGEGVKEHQNRYVTFPYQYRPLKPNGDNDEYCRPSARSSYTLLSEALVGYWLVTLSAPAVKVQACQV